MFAARPSGIVYRIIDPLPFANVVSSPGGGGTTTWTLRLNSTSALTFESSDNGGGNVIQTENYSIPVRPILPGSFWVRLTVTAGTSPDTGTVSSWLSLNGTSQEWAWIRTTVGTTNATVTLEIASDSGGTTIVGTKTGTTLQMEKNP